MGGQMPSIPHYPFLKQPSFDNKRGGGGGGEGAASAHPIVSFFEG